VLSFFSTFYVPSNISFSLKCSSNKCSGKLEVKVIGASSSGGGKNPTSTHLHKVLLSAMILGVGLE